MQLVPLLLYLGYISTRVLRSASRQAFEHEERYSLPCTPLPIICCFLIGVFSIVVEWGWILGK